MPPAIVTPVLGTKLCKILGLDPERVHRLSLDISAHKVVMATIDYIVDVDEIEGIKTELQHYELKRVD